MSIKVLFVNIDVGSGIWHVGETYKQWIKESIGDRAIYSEFNKQVSIEDFSYYLSKENPDIVIVNESFERTLIPIYFYKVYRQLKIVHILHLWQYLFFFEDQPKSSYMHTSYINSCDRVFITNLLPHYVKLPDKYSINKFYNTVHPVNHDEFKITKNWDERQNLFCYVGNIFPHKLSLEFIEKIKSTTIQIDCYGKIEPINEIRRRCGYNEEYLDKFKSCKNLVYKGVVPPNEIPKIFNSYKYFVLPHAGHEPFNLCLLQAIYCGTIPLVVNDRTTDKYDYKWIDWARYLYFGANKVDDFISNLKGIIEDRPDYLQTSIDLREEAINRFKYSEFKREFIGTIRRLIDEVESRNNLKKVE
jgi:hypothetical protein